jgi:ankyrin repeat protein
VVNQEKADGATPLYVACYNGFNDLTELLLEHGANIDQCTDKGYTPLYVACKEGHTKVVKTLTGHTQGSPVIVYYLIYLCAVSD